MRNLSERTDPVEQTIANIAQETLQARGISTITAGDVRRTSDFLHKIIDLIRGTGFSVAVFSDRTPARTLANIFFEIGVALVLGKPVQLVWTSHDAAASAVPSDFVRTEWIRFVVGEEDRLRHDLNGVLDQLEDSAAYYRSIGDIALKASEPDLELAFERYKQAILISGDPQDRRRITQVRNRLALKDGRKRRIDSDIATHRARLLQEVNEFLALLPRIHRH